MTTYIIVFIIFYIIIGLALFKFTRIGREITEEYSDEYVTLGTLILFWPETIVAVILMPILEFVGKIASKIILKEE